MIELIDYEGARRVDEATGLRIGHDLEKRTAFGELLAKTWSSTSECWQQGECVGCRAPMDDSSGRICERCSPLTVQHYAGTPARSYWFAKNCPPYYQQILRSRQARIDWDRVAEVREWDFDGGASLILNGDTGSGKTTAQWALAEKLDEQNTPLLFLGAVDLGRRLSRAAKELCADQELLDCNYLFVDDLGKERLTPAVGALFYELIEERLSWRRPFVFSTRFTGESFEARFDDPILGRDIRRRLRDAARVFVFAGGGIDAALERRSAP